MRGKTTFGCGHDFRILGNARETSNTRNADLHLLDVPAFVFVQHEIAPEPTIVPPCVPRTHKIVFHLPPHDASADQSEEFTKVTIVYDVWSRVGSRAAIGRFQ